jgi:glycosyltransferase involved in cell wall biosynthesis
MKFCMVTTYYPPFHFGGDAIYAYNLANELAKRGHEVDVIHCLDAFRLFAEPDGSHWPNLPGVQVHTLSSKWRSLSPLITQQTGRMGPKAQVIRDVIESKDFDVIHYHNISLMGGTDLLSAGHAIRLCTLHDYWLVCPSHIMFKNNSRACDKPQCFRCQLIHRRPPQLWRSAAKMNKIAGQIDCFLSSSRFAVQLHQSRGVDLSAKILPLFSRLDELSNHHDVTEFKPSEDYFLYAGRLERLKGLQDVLPFFVDSPAHTLKVAGTGGYEDELKKLARKRPNIQFLGNQSAANLRSLFQSARASVVPSLCYEICPTVIAESWSMGTPVIARDIGSLKEVLDNSGGGLTFSDQNELEMQLLQIAGDDELRQQLSEAAYAAFLSDWTANVHLERYFGVIESIRADRLR